MWAPPLKRGEHTGPERFGYSEQDPQMLHFHRHQQVLFPVSGKALSLGLSQAGSKPKSYAIPSSKLGPPRWC